MTRRYVKLEAKTLGTEVKITICAREEINHLWVAVEHFQGEEEATTKEAEKFADLLEQDAHERERYIEMSQD